MTSTLPAPDGIPASPPPAGGVALACWAQCFLDPQRAAAQAQAMAGGGGEAAAWGPVQAALAAALMGAVDQAEKDLAQARAAFQLLKQASGLRWCAEIEAIVLRKRGRTAECQALQHQLDQVDARAGPAPAAPGAPVPEALWQFLLHNARAATARLLGDLDGALRHQFAAEEAAAHSALPGLRLVALSNLGALQQELHNLDDARSATEEALAQARAARSPHLLGTAAANLIVICHAHGEPARGHAAMQQLLAEEAGLLPEVQTRYALQLALAEAGMGLHEAALQRLVKVPHETGSAATRDPSHRLFWHWLHARCRLALGQAEAASAAAEAELQAHDELLWRAHPYLAMELLRAASDAQERCGQTAQALLRLRQAQALYELLAGRAARARYVTLEVGWKLQAAQQERDQARRLQEMAEAEQWRLRQLNDALQAQMAETQRLHAQLREQAVRDTLTGLHNRRFLFEAAPPLLQRAQRDGTPLCVAMLDLDHFKRLNDTHGHDAGDEVLRQFGDLLREGVRAGDLVCRQGGEEFVFVGWGIDAMAALGLMQRLLQRWQARPLRHAGQALPMGSFSAGVAQLGLEATTLPVLLRQADEALYAAKAAGRGRVQRWGQAAQAA